MSPRIERERETLSALPNDDTLAQRKQGGWRIVAVEWERELTAEESAVREEPPFGLHIDDTNKALEIDPTEWNALVLMMELTVKEGPYWSIAEELNRRGYRTRSGGLWTPVSVFQMLPRLIEIGPRVFASEEWQARRSRMRIAGD